MDRRVEELAEGIEEEDPRQDPGEHLEFRIVMFEVHDLMRNDSLRFISFEQGHHAPRYQDGAIGPADSHGQRLLRFHHPHFDVPHALELRQEVDVFLEPLLAFREASGREFPNHRGIAVAPNGDRDDRGG